MTAGEVLTTLHQLTTGQIGRVVTPLELATTPFDLRAMSTILFTAGGRNPDVLGAFEHLVAREPRHLFVVCGAESSPLAKRVRDVTFATFVHIPSPQGKDGYLATNSLLAFVTALGVAYAEMYPQLGPMPSSLPTHWKDPRSFGALKGREHMLVLYDPILRHAAIDIESRFSEAALGTVSVADFRNFAHGRHLWLALRRKETAVLALFRDELQVAAERTLALLPKGSPILRCQAGAPSLAALVHSLTFSLRLAGAVGAAKDMDPGRPRVPQFGRKLYNARLLPKANGTSPDRAVYRKLGVAESGNLPVQLQAFVHRLRRAVLSAIVLDYDGTICSHPERYGSAHEASIVELERLVRGGLQIGIATGRGKSVAKALRQALPEDVWPTITIGYYNCGLILKLSEDPPDWTQDPDLQLGEVFEKLKADASLAARAEVELRKTQITVKPLRPDVRCSDLIAICAAHASHANGLSVVRSTHSIDILPQRVNKTLLLRHIAGEAKGDILAVGDQGRWPGNDYALLHTSLSLSVDETSPSWSTCWNLAPLGLRGPAATAHYLRACKIDPKGWRIDVDQLLGKDRR